MKLFGKPKILVEIIGENGIKQRKKFPIEGNKVVIRPPRRGPGGAGYYVEFDRDCLLPYEVGFGPFKRLKHKLMLIEGADHCISFRVKDGEALVDMPVWDRWSEERLFKANVIKAAGSTIQQVKIPAIIYILLFLTFAMQFITLLVASGRIRIG
jgi:hypothetical protein